MDNNTSLFFFVPNYSYYKDCDNEQRVICFNWFSISHLLVINWFVSLKLGLLKVSTKCEMQVMK